MRRVRVFVEGRVQGVFFRDSMRRRAIELGVEGWVRNLVDGRVEAVFEGPPTAVDAAVGFIRRGPPHARVDSIEVQEEPPRGGLRGFRVLH